MNVKAASEAFIARHTALTRLLESKRDPQERLSWILHQAPRSPQLDPALRTSDLLVPGCAARLWFLGRMEGGLCHFASDSDSAILKASAGLLCWLYDGLPPFHVVTHEAEFLNQSRLLTQFTESRRRTILRIRELIRDFAARELAKSGETPPAGTASP